MYRLFPNGGGIIWNTVTNEQFLPDATSEAAEKWREWVKAGGVTEKEFTKDEKSNFLMMELEHKLKRVDRAVAEERDNGTFSLDGNNFYIDLVTIPGMFMALPYLPSSYTVEWKTADKEQNGIDNVYITVNPAKISAMYLAQMAAILAIWKEGDKKKKEIKKAARDMLDQSK